MAKWDGKGATQLVQAKNQALRQKDETREQICSEIVRLLRACFKNIPVGLAAGRAGLSQSLISTIETNPWNPTIDTLLRIAQVLKINLGKVIEQAESTMMQKQRK